MARRQVPDLHQSLIQAWRTDNRVSTRLIKTYYPPSGLIFARNTAAHGARDRYPFHNSHCS